MSCTPCITNTALFVGLSFSQMQKPADRQLSVFHTTVQGLSSLVAGLTVVCAGKQSAVRNAETVRRFYMFKHVQTCWANAVELSLAGIFEDNHPNNNNNIVAYFKTSKESRDVSNKVAATSRFDCLHYLTLRYSRYPRSTTSWTQRKLSTLRSTNIL